MIYSIINNLSADDTFWFYIAKRAQEMLMFGNQQNRQPEKKPSTSYTSTAEKSEYLNIK